MSLKVMSKSFFSHLQSIVCAIMVSREKFNKKYFSEVNIFNNVFPWLKLMKKLVQRLRTLIPLDVLSLSNLLWRTAKRSARYSLQLLACIASSFCNQNKKYLNWVNFSLLHEKSRYGLARYKIDSIIDKDHLLKNVT